MTKAVCVGLGLLACVNSGHSVELVSAIETILVEGRRINLVGEAISASEGVAGQREIALRPLLRTGEVLELVPGMVVTQHSGTGKANQYFLRGFNLDHGSDFATWVEGMPVNMRSHGHGQGYTDLNFLIPETVESISYKKGTYYADVGDFSGAGSAAIKIADSFERGQAELAVGEDSWYRAVAAGSEGNWLYAVELNRYHGPWTDIDEDLEKINLLLKHNQPLAGGDFRVTVMGYDNRWNSADQIPARAVDSGLINELGSIDPTVGGESSRYSLSAQWQREGLQAALYGIRYRMNLWSNFTYFLDDSSDGDQFEQVDDRWLYGGRVSYAQNGKLGTLPMTNRIGFEWRYDAIDEVALYRTNARKRLGAIRSDRVDQLSGGLYWENQLALTDKLRTVLGVRYDYYDFEVDTRIGMNINGHDLSNNNGSANDDLLSLKASAIYTVNNDWEAYLAAGQGFHSNDARGTIVQVDPMDGSAVSPVDPLVGSLGYEIGLRSFRHDRLNASVALWYLELDSELLFVGDAGNTEPSGKSTRHGLEFTAYYRLNEQWSLDMEYAYTEARFSNAPTAEKKIPGAIEHVWQAGISADFVNGWFGSLRVRYFGERPLLEDGSVTSDPSSVVNLRAGYRTGNWLFKADLLNLFDSDDHDIDYFYESRLPGEAVAVEDIHYHVLEPRTLRLSVAWRY